MSQSVYDFFEIYFSALYFTKIRDQSSSMGDFSMYMARLSAQVCHGDPYVVAYTAKDVNAPGYMAPLQSLKWKSFQTRSLDDDYGLKEQLFDHDLVSQRLGRQIPMLNVAARNYDCAEYYSSFPIKVTLLNDTDLQNPQQWPDRLSLDLALKTQQCVVSMI